MSEDDFVLMCPNCGSLRVTERQIVDVFLYGVGAYPVTLRARCPLLECSDCEQAWTDERGEAAREAAVREHLAAGKS